MEIITKKMEKLAISSYTDKIILIQKVFRGFIVRRSRLPMIMYMVQRYLDLSFININTPSKDGRINSVFDEESVIKLLSLRYKIKIPPIRMWYDILIFDRICGWLPVNIKSTTTKTADNTGNIAMLVHSYTDYILDLSAYCKNGKMSEILNESLVNKKYNRNFKKDYYFIVLDKIKSTVLINSLKGLNILTPNNNNLPFQVVWSKNKDFLYKDITKSIKLFIDCVKKPKKTWKEKFVSDMTTMDI